MVDLEKRKKLKKFLLILSIITLVPFFFKSIDSFFNKDQSNQKNYGLLREKDKNSIYVGEYLQNSGTITKFTQYENSISQKEFISNDFFKDWKNKNNLF